MQLLCYNLAGDQLLHTITLNKPVTCSQTEAEDNINSTVVSLQAIHESAKLAQQGILFYFILFYFILFYFILFYFI